jgi:AraC-like DNA-binding protein
MPPMPRMLQRSMTPYSHLKMHEQRLNPGTEWKPNLPGWWFLHVQDGDGYLWQDPAPRPITTGHVIVSPRAAACHLRASQLGELRLHCFRVMPELLAGILSSLERQRLDALSQRDFNGARLYSPPHPIVTQFTGLTTADAAGDTLLTRCQMLQLVGLVLAEATPTPVPRDSYAVTARDRFEKLILQMPEADLQNESPASLAKLCGCSVRHFSRLFRDHFGHSFVPKKTELKLLKARQLLVESDAKIIDVAFESGFQHVGLFTSLFKKRFGVTPSQYRHRHRSTSRKNNSSHL